MPDKMLEFLSRFPLEALQHGFLGFGAIVFVLVFIILLLNRPAADEGIRRLRKWFLLAGVFCFVVAVAAGIGELLLSAPNSEHNITVTFSPDFATNNLPEPSMVVLPLGSMVKQDSPFGVSADATIGIRMDAIVRHLQDQHLALESLMEANENLGNRWENLQRDIHSRPFELFSAGEAQLGRELFTTDTLEQFQAAHYQLHDSLQQGDAAGARRASERIREVTAEKSDED